MPAPVRSRYATLPASFFTDPRTSGLSPLAAVLYLRAKAESICGALQRSPASLARGHRGVTVRQVVAAAEELAARGLAAWWPDHELLVVRDALEDARGSARGSAEQAAGALPPFARDYLLAGTPPLPSQLDLGDSGTGGLPQEQEQVQEQEQQQEHRGGLSLVHPVKRNNPRPYHSEAQQVLERIDLRRQELGKRPLPPSVRHERWIVARLEEGATVDDMLLAIDLRAAECRRDPANLRYLDAVSPFTAPGSRGNPGGWVCSMRMVEAHAEAQRRRGGVAPRSDAFAGELERVRLEELQQRDRDAAALRARGGAQ